MASVEIMAGVKYDELFAGPEVEVLTKNVTFASGNTIVRGQLISVANGKAAPTAERKWPSSAEKGSSNSSSCGSLTRMRARATRCCCPPES